MSLQTIIDNATFVEMDIREISGSTISRSGHYKTADRNVNIFQFNIGMHDGLTYSTNRGVIQDIYTTGSTTEANISLNNNSGMNYLTAYQGGRDTANLANLSLNTFSGDQFFINTSTCFGTGTIFSKGDFIQPKGNTDTYRYPYMVTEDVTSAGANVAVTVHRPILEQDGVALTSGGFKIGNDVRWQVKIVNLPKYSVVPHDRVVFSDDFELIEVIT